MLLPCFVLIPSGEAALGVREVGAWEAACPAGERAHACVCVYMSYPSTYCALLGVLCAELCSAVFEAGLSFL